VVGSALVDRLAQNLDAAGKAKPGLVDGVRAVLGDIAALAKGIRDARRPA
jgi:tryptophan synthase alpha chain